MTTPWLARTAASGAAASERLAQASDALASKLHDVRHSLARHGEHGLDLARASGDEIAAGLRRAGHSTRSLLAERPVESIVIVGLLGVAIGWILRRSREARHEDASGATRNRPPSAPRAKRTRARANSASA
jgi:ElaB/YqjD/DUF883 family membrane-anchored ribosome-binding protein